MCSSPSCKLKTQHLYRVEMSKVGDDLERWQRAMISIRKKTCFRSLFLRTNRQTSKRTKSVKKQTKLFDGTTGTRPLFHFYWHTLNLRLINQSFTHFFAEATGLLRVLSMFIELMPSHEIIRTLITDSKQLWCARRILKTFSV